MHFTHGPDTYQLTEVFDFTGILNSDIVAAPAFSGHFFSL